MSEAGVFTGLELLQSSDNICSMAFWNYDSSDEVNTILSVMFVFDFW